MIISSLVEMPGDWKKANVSAEFRRDRKEHPENYRPVSLILIPEKVMGQIILEAVNRHKRDKNVIWSIQQRFTQGKSCLTNLISVMKSLAWAVEARAMHCLPGLQKGF